MDANTKDVLMVAVPLIGTLITAAISAWVAVKVQAVGKDVERVEHATNSMKDALVSATASSSHAAGKAEEKREQLAREADQAKGAAAEVRRAAGPPTPPGPAP